MDGLLPNRRLGRATPAPASGVVDLEYDGFPGESNDSCLNGSRGGLERCASGTRQLRDGRTNHLAVPLLHVIHTGAVASSVGFGRR